MSDITISLIGDDSMVISEVGSADEVADMIRQCTTIPTRVIVGVPLRPSNRVVLHKRLRVILMGCAAYDNLVNSVPLYCADLSMDATPIGQIDQMLGVPFEYYGDKYPEHDEVLLSIIEDLSHAITCGIRGLAAQ